MDVVGRKILDEFKRKHSDVQGQVDAWLLEVEEANWDTLNAITHRYPSASILASNLVVFDLRGGNYRLLARVSCRHGTVIVLKAGTHAEYNRWKL